MDHFSAPQQQYMPPAGHIMPQFMAPPQQQPHQASFQPYQNNGGTCLGLSGKDYAIVAADTRMSTGYSIQTRELTKVISLTSKCVLASTGMQADIATLHKTLQARLTMYKHNHAKEMPTTAIAQLLSNTLYFRRFFPYYTFNVLGGVDEQGEGAVFSYDAIGSFERTPVSTSGTGQSLVQPVLDNQIFFANQLKAEKRDVPKEEALDLVKDAFTSAGERDIYTGDYVDICVIDASGVHTERFELKFD